jgi:SAM-dependent methyltransferase
VILLPSRANLRRCVRVAASPHSLLRTLEYERVSGLRLSGRSLDVGGGAGANYRQLLAVDGVLDSVNIDPGMRPSVLADLRSPLPLRSASYDNVISLNTLEHVVDDRLVVEEMLRVLRPGGQFHLLVPFLYRVHQVAGDFHRHTAYWWEDLFRSLGVSSDSVIVEPLVWDPISSAFSLIEFALGRLRSPIRLVLLLQALLHPREWRATRAYGDFALGYYIRGRR